GLSSKEVLERLKAAGVEVKVAASSVEEAVALEALGASGAGEPPSSNGAPAATPPVASAAGAPAQEAPPSPSSPPKSPEPAAPGAGSPAEGASRPAPASRPTGAGAVAPGAPVASAPAAAERVRPTRDSRTGERTPGDIGPGGRRRVVIDSQASRRQQGGPANQPQRRPRRGRRRRGTYDDTIAPIDNSASTATDVIRVNSGSTVKDVAEYLGVPVPEI